MVGKSLSHNLFFLLANKSQGQSLQKFLSLKLNILNSIVNKNEYSYQKWMLKMKF